MHTNEPKMETHFLVLFFLITIMILYCPFKWFTIQSCKNDLKEQLE